MIGTKQAAEAVARLAALKHFPGDPIARAEIARLLMRMVENESQLEWLLQKMIDQVGEWPGPRELRAVYTTRFKPLDGIEAASNIPGFAAADSEAARSLESEKWKQLEGEAPRSSTGLKRITATPSQRSKVAHS